MYLGFCFPRVKFLRAGFNFPVGFVLRFAASSWDYFFFLYPMGFLGACWEFFGATKTEKTNPFGLVFSVQSFFRMGFLWVIFCDLALPAVDFCSGFSGEEALPGEMVRAGLEEGF
jgi:hypothetical protein